MVASLFCQSMLVFFFLGGGGVLTKNGEGKSYFIELYRDLSRNVFLQESSQLCGVNFAKDLHPKKTWIPKMMVFPLWFGKGDSFEIWQCLVFILNSGV